MPGIVKRPATADRRPVGSPHAEVRATLSARGLARPSRLALRRVLRDRAASTVGSRSRPEHACLDPVAGDVLYRTIRELYVLYKRAQTRRIVVASELRDDGSVAFHVSFDSGGAQPVSRRSSATPSRSGTSINALREVGAYLELRNGARRLHERGVPRATLHRSLTLPSARPAHSKNWKQRALARSASGSLVNAPARAATSCLRPEAAATPAATRKCPRARGPATPWPYTESSLPLAGARKSRTPPTPGRDRRAAAPRCRRLERRTRDIASTRDRRRACAVLGVAARGLTAAAGACAAEWPRRALRPAPPPLLRVDATHRPVTAAECACRARRPHPSRLGR